MMEYGGCSQWGPIAPDRWLAHWASTISEAGNVDMPQALILPARTRSLMASTVSAMSV